MADRNEQFEKIGEIEGDSILKDKATGKLIRRSVTKYSYHDYPLKGGKQ